MEKGKSKLLWIGGVVLLALLVVGAGIWWFSPAQQQQRRNNALFTACTAGSVNAVQDALAQGGDANARDRSGITPLMFAAKGDFPNMNDPEATDHLAVVQLLIKKGADVNATTDTGFVALFWAARYGHEKVVKSLVENGANVNAKDKDGLTAMTWANTNRKASPPHYDRVIAHLQGAGKKE